MSSDHSSSVDLGRFAALVPDLLAITKGIRFLWLNDRWEKVLGWTFQEMTTQPATNFIHPEDVEQSSRMSDKLSEMRDGLEQFVNRYLTRDGETRWLEWSGDRHGDEWYWVVRNITDRMTELQTRERQLHLQEMGEELANYGHWLFDLRDEQVHWSKQVARVHGERAERCTLSLQQALDYYHPEDRPLVSAHVNRCVETGRSFDFRARIIRGDGAMRHVQARGERQCDAAQNPVAIFGIVMDVTSEREMQELMARTERLTAIGRLASGVAHEINNPLAILSANLSWMAERQRNARATSDPLAKEFLAIIEESRDASRRISEVVNALSKLSSAGTSHISRLNIQELLDNARKLVAVDFKDSATIQWEVGKDLPTIVAQPGKLVQAFVNVIENAIQAGEGGDAEQNLVRVAAHEEDGHIVIQVSDTGTGIPEENLTRVFDPFFSTRPVGRGTGLGLAVAHATIQELGGDVSIESEVGHGTTVTVRIPTNRETGDLQSGEERAPDISTPRADESTRVLVVDDEHAVANAIRRTLDPEHEVTIARNGREALAALNANFYDAVVCDLRMPDIGGIEVYRTATELDPAIAERFIFLSGGLEEAEAQSFITSTQRPCIEKPFDLDELRAVVGRVASNANTRK